MSLYVSVLPKDNLEYKVEILQHINRDQDILKQTNKQAYKQTRKQRLIKQ